jgi:hypothetical protein
MTEAVGIATGTPYLAMTEAVGIATGTPYLAMTLKALPQIRTLHLES